MWNEYKHAAPELGNSTEHDPNLISSEGCQDTSWCQVWIYSFHLSQDDEWISRICPVLRRKIVSKLGKSPEHDNSSGLQTTRMHHNATVCPWGLTHCSKILKYATKSAKFQKFQFRKNRGIYIGQTNLKNIPCKIFGVKLSKWVRHGMETRSALMVLHAGSTGHRWIPNK